MAENIAQLKIDGTANQSLDEFFAPSAINITPNSIQIGGKIARTLFYNYIPQIFEYKLVFSDYKS